MSKRSELMFFVLAVLAVVLGTTLMTAFPQSHRFEENVTTVTKSQRARLSPPGDPLLVVPESTMRDKQPSAHNWADNPVATIPESTMGRDLEGYTHNWVDNSVATIPESTMERNVEGYPHNWMDNPVATIPESTMR